MKLTPEDLQRVEDKKVANILRKIYTEKRTPTAREDAIMQRAGLGQPAESPAPVTGYAANWDELARLLGVTRRAIQEWRKDPRYLIHTPPDRADGRKEVAAWLAFMVRFGLKRADENVAIDPRDRDDELDEADIIKPPPVAGSQAEWNVAIAALDHRKKENVIRVQEGTLLIAAELEIPLGAFLAALQSKLNQFPDMAARRVCGIADEAECRDHLRDEIDAIATDLQLGRYLAADAIAEAVSEPLPPELNALCEKLLFAGSDRTALLDLARAIATEAVRKIGRTAINQTKGALRVTASEVALPTAPSATGNASADASAPLSQPPKVLGKKAASKTTTSADGKSKGRKRKPRPQPTPPPPEIEATIVATRPKPKHRKRR